MMGQRKYAASCRVLEPSLSKNFLYHELSTPRVELDSVEGNLLPQETPPNWISSTADSRSAINLETGQPAFAFAAIA
jgi:hypothetical protein